MFSYKYSLCICICSLVLPSSSIEDFLHSIISTNGLNPDYQNKIYFILFKGNTSSGKLYETYNSSLSKAGDLKKYMNFQIPVVLYIHGFTEHYANESIQTIIRAYIKKGQHNLLILDWSAFSFENYAILSKRIKIISMHTAKGLENLVNAGMNTETLHIVSHSLGCQLAGFIGRFLSFQIPRITALDPASPLFYQFNAEHISSNSARQVDVIHTDGGGYGAFPKTGTSDFYPNGGLRPQPGCTSKNLFNLGIGLCSHQMSWRFYAESVENEKAFPALLCNSYLDFLNNKCKQNEIVYFGYGMDPKVSGDYYFQTNVASPYGKELEGIFMK